MIANCGNLRIIARRLALSPPLEFNFEQAGKFSRTFCGLCEKSGRRHLTTTTVRFKNERKKEPLRFKPKKQKSENVLAVWRGMTVQEVADLIDRDTNHVFEALEFIEDGYKYKRPSSVIDSIHIIQQIIHKSGMRSMTIQPPKKEVVVDESYKDAKRRAKAQLSATKPRPPVVTIMGHVDHGKTTLLDSLRKSAIVQQEFGGITQHIGAFCVTLPSGAKVTFLDTPGHAAFTAMRARGANVTDIVVLVVAADDGVLDQTVESIRLAKEARVEIIVAINKIDKPKKDIELCKKQLLQHGIQLEDYGGDIQSVPISALNGTNLDGLVQAILTQAELMELRADYTGLVEGFVIESKQHAHKGKIATVLVQRGTLNTGSFLVAGNCYAKVRTMQDEFSNPLSSVTPAMAAEVAGWKELPSAGDELLQVDSERRAKEVVDYRQNKEQHKLEEEASVIVERRREAHQQVYKAALDAKRADGIKYRRRMKTLVRPKEVQEEITGPELALVLKADVDGSVEAIMDVLNSYSSESCRLSVLDFGVGAISPSDVDMAEAFNGVIYAFNVPVLPSANEKARETNVTIKEHNVIYRLVDDVRNELSARLPLKDQEIFIGEATVLQEFIVTEGKKKVAVAGCRCVKGSLKKSAFFRLMRDEVTVEDKLVVASLRHLKNEVESIKKEVECGLRLSDRDVRFEVGDTLVCYEMTKVEQKTDWNPGF